MNPMVRIIGAVLVGAAGCSISTGAEEGSVMSEFKVSSTAFADGGKIPQKHAYKHGNVSPPLAITGVPEKAQSLVLIVDDPDAPAKVWVHWLVANLSPATVAVKEGEIPPGAIVGANDFGQSTWGGPMPPSGTHRYYFRLSALDTVLELKPGFSRAELERKMKGHILRTTQLMGRYSAGE